MVPPASDPAAELLGGLEHTCWPTEATWVLRGAGGRARAGLLWVWGIGRALCTGLALGSPDFISEPTRRAGIFLRGRLVTARCPPSAAAGDGNPAAHMRSSKTPTAKASPGRAGGGGTLGNLSAGPAGSLQGYQTPQEAADGLKKLHLPPVSFALNHREEKFLHLSDL